MLKLHKCRREPGIPPSHPLARKKVYLPIMAQGASEAVAASFHRMGVDAEVGPPPCERTIELGRQFVAGDECYPAVVTLGDFLRVVERAGFQASRSVFFMATAEGPCRFGQYVPCLKRVLRDIGCADAQVISPNSKNGYADLGGLPNGFQRLFWRALVATDTLHQALLRTRPYETVPGTADRAYAESLRDLCAIIETSCAKPSCQLRSLVAAMTRARQRFRGVPARYDLEIPLIGIVGEIFCRLNAFSNQDLIRKIEAQHGEVWLSEIAELVEYDNETEVRDLRLNRRGMSLEMAAARLRSRVQQADLHALTEPFQLDSAGYEEPEISEILDKAEPYLPASGVIGEMVVSAGRAAYLAEHGVDGIIDISPFSCMNGTVTEAIYPRLSRDYGRIPIRNFYFDGTSSDLERDLGIYLELARCYRETKPYARRYPWYFGQPRLEEKAAPTPQHARLAAAKG